MTQFARFEKTYRPILKSENSNSGQQTFETFGDEYEFVKHVDFHHVWTVVEADNCKMYVTNGFHHVNRQFYIITEIPWKDGESLEFLY